MDEFGKDLAELEREHGFLAISPTTGTDYGCHVATTWTDPGRHQHVSL